MSTLLDNVDVFLAKYIRKAKAVKLPNKVEDDLPFKASDFSEKSDKFAMIVDDKVLTQRLRRNMALSTPFYMKGLKKKSRDTFRAGWEFRRSKDNKAPSRVELDILQRFNDRVNIKNFMTSMKQDAHVYGDGFCLMVFINDQDIRKPRLHASLREGAEPFQLKRLNPEHIVKRRYYNKEYQNLNIKHYVYADEEAGGSKVFIHPDRVLHFKETDFAFSSFGVSDMDMLRNIISSGADVDIATGNILRWFSYGIVEWTKEGLKPNERKEMLKFASKHPHTFVGNEKYKLAIHNPTAIDPQPFYDYLIMSIAAILVMPSHVLKGLGDGEKSGAEIGYSDYYKDIYDSQELIYKPQLRKLYELLFKSSNRIFDYNIIFNPVYVGELAEAEVDGKRAATAVNLKASAIVDTEEARRMYNEGHIYLDPTKEIKVEKVEDSKEPIAPITRTEQPAKKQDADKNKSADNKLKKMKAMIEARKVQDMIDDPSEFETKLQEVRVRKAEKAKLDRIKKRIKELDIND